MLCWQLLAACCLLPAACCLLLAVCFLLLRFERYLAQEANADKVTQGKATRSAIYFFKRNSIWAVTGTSPLEFEVENVTMNFGLNAPRGVVSDGQGVYFASDDGIYYVNG